MTALVARWHALPPNLRGILWVGLSGLLFALLNVFTLIPAEHLNTYVMAFLRYSFGALFLLRGMNLGVPYLSPKVTVEAGAVKQTCCHK